MAVPASSVSLSSFRIKLFKDQPCQFHKRSLSPGHQRPHICSIKLTMAHFNEPNKAKTQMNIVRERLWEATPDTVKDFPWKNAENIVLQRLLFVGEKALKWSLIILFIFSSLSDVVFSISRNKELMIPFGLYVGCKITDFLKETSQELIHISEERGFRWQFLGISCFFVLVKFLSTFFSVQGRVFLLHVANGGLMQVLWMWRSFTEETDRSNAENGSTPMDDD